MIGPVMVLNVILPTADIVSDLLTVIKLYVGVYGCDISSAVLVQVHVCEFYTLDNKTYTCDGLWDLWNKCKADPRGFSDDPENVTAISYGVLRHPKFATMLLGKLDTKDTHI